MKTKAHFIPLFLILVFSFYTRLSHLTTNPPALFSDEVDAGFQALSFNRFHSDYYGNKFPIHFRSFSDWRTSLYIYTISLTESLVHSPSLSVRLPSAIFSILSVLVLYFTLIRTTKSQFFSLTAAAALALSPWNIHYGRTGFEVSGMIFCLLLALYLFFVFVDRHWPIFLYYSALLLVISTYFYSTAKLFIPFIFLTLLLVFFQELKKVPLQHYILLPIFVVLLSAPLIIDTVRGRSGFRFSYISIFTEPTVAKTVDYLRYTDIFTSHLNEVGVRPSLFSQIVHNKLSLTISKFVHNYLSSFSLDFLAFYGDSNVRHGFGGHGLIYPLQLILIFTGISTSLIHCRRLSALFLAFLLFSPIPFSLTRDSVGPHATRLILLTIPFSYFTAQGISFLKSKFPPLIGPIFILYFFSFILFWHYYRFHYPQSSARTWHNGITQTINKSVNLNYDHYFFSNNPEPMLPFFLFHQRYLTAIPISQHLHDSLTPYFDGRVLDDRYYFGSIHWDSSASFPAHSLIITSKTEYSSLPQHIKQDYKLVDQINKSYIESEEYYLLTPVYDQE